MLARVRALLIIALLWAAVWIPAGFALQILLDRVGQGTMDHPTFVWTWWGLWGALSGMVFALALAVLERGRTSGSLSFRRIVSWGAIGSLFIVVIGSLFYLGLPEASPYYWTTLLAYVGVGLVVGALCAGATLGLARLTTR